MKVFRFLIPDHIYIKQSHMKVAYNNLYIHFVLIENQSNHHKHVSHAEELKAFHSFCKMTIRPGDLK